LDKNMETSVVIDTEAVRVITTVFLRHCLYKGTQSISVC
jgi:hypothetical protein